MSGGFEFSYLWVANTDQGSISKINTFTQVEEGRYYSDPVEDAIANPSRTSVNIDGRYVVVSNRGAGTVTKVAANKDDCVDKNNDGIETSPDKDTLLPYESEDCILWTTKVNTPYALSAGPRATAWDPGTYNEATCEYVDQKVWVGYMAGPGMAEIARINGDSGEIEATVPLPNWPVTVEPTGFAPYGAAVDADGNIWTTAVFSSVVVRINRETLEVTSWTAPYAGRHYGMTVDDKGRVWFANNDANTVGVTVFDPADESWTAIPGTEAIDGRGVAADTSGGVWVATNPAGAMGCGLLQVDSETLTVITHHTFEKCQIPLGVSVDVDGMIWMVDYYGWAYMINPVTYEKTLVTIPNIHYTYSDMTGGGLAGVIKPQ